MTSMMRAISSNLGVTLTIGLRQVFVIHPGERRFDLGEKIEAVPIRQLATLRGEVQ